MGHGSPQDQPLGNAHERPADDEVQPGQPAEVGRPAAWYCSIVVTLPDQVRSEAGGARLGLNEHAGIRAAMARPCPHLRDATLARILDTADLYHVCHDPMAELLGPDKAALLLPDPSRDESNEGEAHCLAWRYSVLAAAEKLRWCTGESAHVVGWLV
jgi:hypothetical protein